MQGNRSNPGDYFTVVLGQEKEESGIEWVEVTEVFETTAIAKNVEGTCRA